MFEVFNNVLLVLTGVTVMKGMAPDGGGAAMEYRGIPTASGPVPGQVVGLKSPGVVDGTIFNGMHSIVIVSGNGVDKVDIKAELSSNLDLSAMSDNGEIILKGQSSNFVVNGLMKGGELCNDSLKLFMEGPATGAPVLDGGTGQDSCSTSLGTVINCE
jgi:hypothetical protein